MTSPVEKVYDLLHAERPGEPPLFIGDTVYLPLLEPRREPRFVVDAKIVEVQFVVVHPAYKEDNRPVSLWFNIAANISDKGYELVGPKIPIERDALGWSKQGSPDPELVLDPNVKLGNWFLWLDLPIGHAVSPYIDVTPFLSDALDVVAPFKGRKRHGKSALNSYIKSGSRFIASTHNKTVEQMGFMKYRTWPERKVYWRRK